MTRSRRATIGIDPIALNTVDLLTAPPRALKTKSDSLQKQRPRTSPSAKQRFTVHLSAELIDAVKDAAIALSGPPHRLTLAQLAEDAFRREVDRLQKANGGKPFVRRAADSTGGRPIKRRT